MRELESGVIDSVHKMSANETKPRPSRTLTIVATILSIGWGTYDIVENSGASRPLGVIILLCGNGLAIGTLFDVLKEKRARSRAGQVSK